MKHDERRRSLMCIFARVGIFMKKQSADLVSRHIRPSWLILVLVSRYTVRHTSCLLHNSMIPVLPPCGWTAIGVVEQRPTGEDEESWKSHVCFDTGHGSLRVRPSDRSVRTATSGSHPGKATFSIRPLGSANLAARAIRTTG